VEEEEKKDSNGLLNALFVSIDHFELLFNVLQ
jgi:hypothetical protein